MKLELRNVIMYGEWDSEEDYKYEENYWFEKSSFALFYSEKLIEEFGYKDCDEIKSSGHFIPFFKTDIVALQKEFIANYPDKAVEETINDIIRNDNYGYSSGFVVAFRILTQDYPEFDEFSRAYYAFEKNQLTKDAEEWCERNNIPYYSEYDPERKLDLRDTVPWAYGTSVMDDSGEWVPQTVWFYKKTFEILDPSYVDVVYGLKNYDEIMASGNFIPLFKVMQEDVETFCISNNITEEAYIFEYAKKWCAKNNIPYYISKNTPDHMGSLFNKTNH